MKREVRYILLKLKDVDAALTPDQRETLKQLQDRVAIYRYLQDKRPLRAVIVEDDWPEYEPVWEMIECRVDGRSATEGERGMTKDERRKTKDERRNNSLLPQAPKRVSV
jgi:hypothetical protein